MKTAIVIVETDYIHIKDRIDRITYLSAWKGDSWQALNSPLAFQCVSEVTAYRFLPETS